MLFIYISSFPLAMCKQKMFVCICMFEFNLICSVTSMEINQLYAILWTALTKSRIMITMDTGMFKGFSGWFVQIMRLVPHADHISK